METEELIELLFFDTFSHEINEDINLDLVQFPKPVYIAEIRIIPLGARVQADFPGGVRLGATNPSKFDIEFFVNDLGKPGACTFESLGNLEYNQNDRINLECHDDKIPTDGLVLRGWYTTITLAVYGTLTKNLAEPISSPPPAENLLQEINITPTLLAATEEEKDDQKWRKKTIVFERELYKENSFEDNLTSTYNERINFYQSCSNGTKENDKKSCNRRTPSPEKSVPHNHAFSRSSSNDQENISKQKREWSQSPDHCHFRHKRDKSRESDHVEHKRPKTPPQINSPRHPRSPEASNNFSNLEANSNLKVKEQDFTIQNIEETEEFQDVRKPNTEEIHEPLCPDDETLSQDEPFEPILSDDEIIGDDENEQENDDIDMDDHENAIKMFDPFKMEIEKYVGNIKQVFTEECDILNKLFRKYELLTKIDKHEKFLKWTAEEKEDFVHISEQLLSQSNSFKRLNIILEEVFNNQNKNLNLMINVIKVALDFECACSQPQPGYKIRHIKCGVRMIELLGSHENYLKYLINVANYNPFNKLFNLYSQDYMALSIKLMILKAIYSLLDTKFGIDIFLHNKINGYQKLLLLLESNPLTRAKFSIKSVIKKLHLYEALENISDMLTRNLILKSQFIESDFADLESCLKEIINALVLDKMSYEQPKRFLPVSKKFEINKDIASEKTWNRMLNLYFKIHSLAESLVLIISNQTLMPATVLDTLFDLIDCLLESSIGIAYFVEDSFEVTQILVKSLLNIDSSNLKGQHEQKDDGEIEEKDKRKTPTRVVSRAQKLGVHLAFAIQTRYHLDSITHMEKKNDFLIDHLHSLYSQTCYYPGRNHTVETISMDDNITPLLNLIENERKLQTQCQNTSPGVKYKSPILSYSVDIIDCIVRHCKNLNYLMKHNQFLLDLVKNHEIFEPSVSAVLQEMSVYLKPVDVLTNFSYDDIKPLCDIIKRSIEYITTFPGDLIMSLRILQLFVIGNEHINSKNEIKELKHRYVLLQFYSYDGVVILINILEKLNSYFDQPGLHSSILMTMQAVYTCQIIYPTIRVLREILTFVIQCRDTEFKDLTVIEQLMRTYCLMHYYPELSQAYDEAQKIKSEIIKMFLAYTQPNQQDQESIHKSLWTQMIHEVIKGILIGPSTFIPGLQAFAELLPLPLPVPTLKRLTDSECQRLITERRLWSAHLHPESSLLSELIQTICPSSFPQLSDLLIRVCLQLADLAPNMTLLVSKTVIDLISTECSNCNGVGTASLARLLKFLCQLTAYASVKISSCSIFSGKLYDYFNQILCNTTEQSDFHLTCQQNILQILENFFDSEISMITSNQTENLDLNLSCALPSKEFMPSIINALLTNLLNVNQKGRVILSTLRTLIILTEHNITFFHLYRTLINKKEKFRQWFQKLAEVNDQSEVNRNILSTLILFFRALIQIEESTVDSVVPPRTMKLSVQELIELTSDCEDLNTFKKLKNFLENQEMKNEEFIQEIKNFLELIENQIETSVAELTEPILPQAEGIVTQYLSRTVYSVYEVLEDSQLTANYWLEPIRLDDVNEVLAQLERIPCDLLEMATSCLSEETNLTSECKRILHLSASPQSSRERTTTAPCFRTRRVEVEPSTGRPEKKIYLSPMRGRGFPRIPPSRGDLFRSRPPNTSRPPSLHVDDFLALETCGAQPTGPTGYNKLARDLINIRGTRSGRNRCVRIASVTSYRTGSSSTWSHIVVDPNAPLPPQHFRTATSEPVVTPHFTNDPLYTQPHFGGIPVRSRGRGRTRTFIR